MARDLHTAFGPFESASSRRREFLAELWVQGGLMMVICTSLKKALSAAAVSLALYAGCETVKVTAAHAAPFTLAVSGIIGSQNGSLASASPFTVGDSFTYSVTLDDSMTGPTVGGTARQLTNVTNFSFGLGSYLASGSSGDVFLRNNGSTGVFGGAPYDQVTVQHLSEPVYAAGFGLPGRTDFQSTGGPIGGQELRSIEFAFQTPAVEFVSAGASLLSMFRSIGSNPAALDSNSAGGGGFFGVSFNNEAFGSVPLSINLEIDHIQVNDVVFPSDIVPSTGSEPVPTGFTPLQTFVFNAPQSGNWFDPPFADGFLYELTGDGEFIEVFGVPGFLDLQVLVGDLLVEADLDPGESYVFGPGVKAMSIVGILPPVDAADPTAFPTFLNFSGSPSELRMTALAQGEIVFVAEPESIVVMGIGLLVLLWSCRRRMA